MITLHILLLDHRTLILYQINTQYRRYRFGLASLLVIWHFFIFVGKYVGNRPIKLRKSTWRDRQIDVVKKKEREKKRLGLK